MNNLGNIGFGDTNFNFAVYIANKPNMLEYQELSNVVALAKGEIDVINQSCGNGWRKVFNVYAKLLYCLNKELFDYSALAPSWQNYRDNTLLQANAKNALLFSTPNIDDDLSKGGKSNKKVIHIISGKGHAKALISSGNLKVQLTWLDEEFAIDKENRLVVCPYFDYRQLSNIKIERLANLLTMLKQHN